MFLMMLVLACMFAAVMFLMPPKRLPESERLPIWQRLHTLN